MSATQFDYKAVVPSDDHYHRLCQEALRFESAPPTARAAGGGRDLKTDETEASIFVLKNHTGRIGRVRCKFNIHTLRFEGASRLLAEQSVEVSHGPGT